MTEWLDVFVYAALTVTLWFVVPAWAAGCTHAFLMDRNPEWVRRHPHQVRALSSTGGLRIACAVWAVISLAALLVFQLGPRPGFLVRLSDNTASWEALKDLNSTLIIIGSLCLISAAIASWDRACKMVPLADRRHAVLERRTLGDFVPLPIRVATYGIVSAVLLAWLVAGVLDMDATPMFWPRFAFFVLLSLVFAYFVHFIVRRPPHVMDRVFGPAFRLHEVRWVFALQLLAPVMGAVRLYEEVSNTVSADMNRAMHLGVALLVTLWALRLRKYSPAVNTPDGGRQSGVTLVSDRGVERQNDGRRPMFLETHMKTVTRSIVIIALLASAITLRAQNPQGLAGQWQGTLQAGKELRLVFMLTPNAAGGGYTATMHSIDQGGQGITAVPLVQGGTVRLSVAQAGITFEGKLAADGNSIVGTFTQGPGSMPLTLTRATKETAFALPAPPKTMARDAPLTFEVASIKKSVPDAPGKLFTVKGRDVMTINTTLADLMTMAYDVHLNQIAGAPSWMENDKFDIIARPVAEGVPNVEQLRGLLRGLLADRFRLTTHTDKKEMPAYVLRVGTGAHKMTLNTANPTGLPGLFFKQLGVLNVVNAEMGQLTALLQSSVLDRPVVDGTKLEGRFDFVLSWTPDDSQFRSFGPRPPAPVTPDPNAPPGLFTAIQEQLGLRLERANAPVSVIVIDRVEKPSDN